MYSYETAELKIFDPSDEMKTKVRNSKASNILQLLKFFIPFSNPLNTLKPNNATQRQITPISMYNILFILIKFVNPQKA